ncbi:hypothetical protein PIB30_101750 [Stylosanthes scabra]|uniref:Uncharacterized protein n=1 Tax=Stylosanthes scabra TaxID=79078 RepID=A0ABU6XXN9_9FABA|nr:hypothetical protein [Stylosanthes scabra]
MEQKEQLKEILPCYMLVVQLFKERLGKNEERQLAEQETNCGSKTEQELHAYAWKSTHMRAT